MIVCLNGLTERYNRMVYYPKPAVEDITKSPSPDVPARQWPADDRHPKQPEPPEDRSKIYLR